MIVILLVCGGDFVSTAERLRKLREARRWTQAHLGKLLNVSPQVVSNWERGYTPISADAVATLARVFGVSSDFLLGIKDAEKEPAREWTQLKKLLHDDDSARKRLARKLGMRLEDIRALEAREIEPTLNMSVTIAEHFGTNLLFLAGLSETENEQAAGQD